MINEVTYIDHMGNDLLVVNAARVSFKKKDIELTERGKKLIQFLVRNDHWSPSSHPQLCLHIKAPMFVARQAWRSHVGASGGDYGDPSWNEVSRRYVDDEPEFYVPTEWRKRADNIKQGSSSELVYELDHPEGMEDLWGDVDNNYHPSLHAEYQTYAAKDFYNWLLRSSVAPEQARMFLPMCTYTEWYWTGSLAFWARFYKLRSDPHAQLEIQDLAEQIGNICADIFPTSWEALISKPERLPFLKAVRKLFKEYFDV